MNWISVVILLVALSMVNASPFHIYKRDNSLHKRAVPLEACEEASTIPLEGSVDPDPVAGTPAKAKVSFVTTAEVAKVFLTTTVAGPDAAKAKVTTADLCAADSGLKCPVAKGQEVTITTTTEIPADVGEPFGIEYNVNDGEIVIACGLAKAKAAGGAAPPKEAPKEAPKDGDAPKDAPKDGDAPKDAPKDGDAPKDAPKDGGAPDGGAPKDGGAPDDGAPDDGAPDDGAPDGGDDGPPEP